jgi:hypothetical protein
MVRRCQSTCSNGLASKDFHGIVTNVDAPYALEKRTRFNFLQHLGGAIKTYPDLDFSEALSQGQIQSKKWLIEHLENMNLDLGTIFVLGGWWGILPAMIFESNLRFEKIRSFDSDPTCAPIADKFNSTYLMDGWRFKASTLDMLTLDYLRSTFSTRRADGSSVELCEIPNTIINTSCEHLTNFSDWWRKIPNQKLLVLQSNNNFAAADHVNAVNSLEEFEASAPLNEVFFRGSLPLQGYNRFMLIGRK